MRENTKVNVVFAIGLITFIAFVLVIVSHELPNSEETDWKGALAYGKENQAAELQQTTLGASSTDWMLYLNATYEIGLRADGVVVWRKREE